MVLIIAVVPSLLRRRQPLRTATASSVSRRRDPLWTTASASSVASLRPRSSADAENWWFAAGRSRRRLSFRARCVSPGAIAGRGYFLMPSLALVKRHWKFSWLVRLVTVLILWWFFGLVQLSKKVVDMSELRSLACQGIPDAAGIRSTVWKVRFPFHYVFFPTFSLFF